MKKVMSMALCGLMIVTALAGCGGTSTNGSSSNYQEVIEAARPAELNDIDRFNIVSDAKTVEEAGLDAQDEQAAQVKHDDVFGPAGGFVEEDMERYAISLGATIIQVYGVAIILPAEGKQQAVMDQVNAYIESQKKAQENYLPDQYKIANEAIVKVAASGEILLAMCENADEVMAAMEEGLKG